MRNGRGPAATYLYCLVHGKEPPSLAGVPSGLPGMRAPRLLDAGNSLWLVAADAPLARYGKSPIEEGLRNLKWVAACAVAHEQVIEHFTDAGTVIPMKLFTLFTTDNRALLHIKDTRKKLDKVIERVAQCQEWGVRIRFNEARTDATTRPKMKILAPKAPTGTQFLLLKKKEQDFARQWKERALAEAESAYQELARYGEDARRLPSVEGEPDGRVILDAAFLVPFGKEKRFRGAVKRLTARGAQAYNVTLTGPWPPYNFVVKAE